MSPIFFVMDFHSFDTPVAHPEVCSGRGYSQKTEISRKFRAKRGKIFYSDISQ